jgi:NAD(P)-dependent dehydrogenase (short-subunit alcohol dehydrogenase family)
MDLAGKSIVVTGGNRGLGAGVVEALIISGARVIVVSRDGKDAHKGDQEAQIDRIVGGITDAHLAQRIIADHAPDAIVLNAGAVPPTLPIDLIEWDDFSNPWETDVKGALFWIQASLTAPLRQGSTVLSVASGAAVNGSPLSGGYAGAKRMLWLMSNYANGISVERNLGILFQTVLPLQMIAGTGVGDAAAAAYAERTGTDPEAFLARFGAPMTPQAFGAHVTDILERADRTVRAYGVKGDTGLTPLETAAV